MADEALIEEVEKLQKLQQEGTSGDLKQNNNNMLEDDQFMALSNTSSITKTKKRKSCDASEQIVRSTPCEKGEDNSVVRVSALQNLSKDTATGEVSLLHLRNEN